ncbi:TetR/AcrR family transcriptional regulator [Streptomyces sp. NPDC050704]|uniref:TetR/AcrR family transcriptional regulator n=1 Tax=Streptomyces sp. NPDC050704 TaxID=3157219 RepID=UPI00341557C4
MPKYVDPELRAKEITDAAVRVLGEGGFAKLTLRNLAKRLGGSITLVTHYFPNRDVLITGILEHFFAESDQFAEELAAIADPAERLHAALLWFLPVDEETLVRERGRIALVAHRDADAAVDDFITRLEPAMRAILAQGIAGFVEDDEFEVTLDLLRSWTTGMALSAVEHPEIWTVERQLRALDRFLALLSMPAVHRVNA